MFGSNKHIQKNHTFRLAVFYTAAIAISCIMIFSTVNLKLARQTTSENFVFINKIPVTGIESIYVDFQESWFNSKTAINNFPKTKLVYYAYLYHLEYSSTAIRAVFNFIDYSNHFNVTNKVYKLFCSAKEGKPILYEIFKESNEKIVIAYIIKECFNLSYINTNTIGIYLLYSCPPPQIQAIT